MPNIIEYHDVIMLFAFVTATLSGAVISWAHFADKADAKTWERGWRAGYRAAYHIPRGDTATVPATEGQTDALLTSTRNDA